MSIWDCKPFMNSAFAETAQYKTSSIATAIPITVIVNRDGMKENSFKKSEVQSVSYPLTVEIQKTEVAIITPKTNLVNVKNMKYLDEWFLIKEIVYADEYIWRVAV